MSPYRMTKTELSRLLLQKNLVTPEQLQEAVDLQRSKMQGKLLGHILVDLKYLKREDLNFVLAIQAGYPYIDIKKCLIEPEILALIPEETIRKYQIFPIDRIQDVVTVAMVNPLDQESIEEIEESLSLNLKVFLAVSSDLQELIKRYFVKKSSSM